MRVLAVVSLASGPLAAVLIGTPVVGQSGQSGSTWVSQGDRVRIEVQPVRTVLDAVVWSEDRLEGTITRITADSAEIATRDDGVFRFARSDIERLQLYGGKKINPKNILGFAALGVGITGFWALIIPSCDGSEFFCAESGEKLALVGVGAALGALGGLVPRDHWDEVEAARLRVGVDRGQFHVGFALSLPW